jgi:hypothetical protein
MEGTMMLLFIGIAIGLAIGVAFILFCLWHVKRYPLVKDELDDTELAPTAVYDPPPYNLRVASK